MKDPVELRNEIRMGQYRTNSGLVDPYRSLAEGGRVQRPKEPNIETQDNDNFTNTLDMSGPGQGGSDARFEPHPLLKDLPDGADPNNSKEPNSLPREVLQQVIEGRDSNASVPVLQHQLQMQLQADLSKKLSLGLTQANTNTPTLRR